jgi:hypothetical protein
MYYLLFLIAAAVVFVIIRFRSSGGFNDPHAPAAGWKPASRAPASGDQDNPVVDAEVISMIRRGNTRDATQMYRELHGTDIKTAKDAVDALAKTLLP